MNSHVHAALIVVLCTVLCFYRAVTNVGDILNRKLDSMKKLVEEQANQIKALTEKVTELETTTNDRFKVLLEKLKKSIDVPNVVQVRNNSY